MNRRSACLGILTIISCFLLSPAGWADRAADRKAMLEGVTAIAAPGAIPGPLAVFGDDAFVVLTAREGKARVPLVAAAHWGKGRIVAIGHEAFVHYAPQNKGNARFLENCIVWAGRGRPAPQTLRVGTFDPELISVLRSDDADGVLLTQDDYSDIASRLLNLDVLYLEQGTLDKWPDAVRAVREWISRDGGGVIIAGPGWGWKEVTGKDLATEQSANQICRDAGIAWADGMLEATGKNETYLADGEGIETSHASAALTLLTRFAENKAALAPGDIAQATQVLTQTAGSLPLDDKNFLPRIDGLCQRFAGEVIPTQAKPVTPAEPFARLKIVLESQHERHLPPEKIKANPAAVSFPGPVPDKTPRLQRDISVDLTRPGWLSTGLYAAPGEVITMLVPPAWANKGLAVRIGAHTDTLWHLEKWERWPDISRRWQITRAITRACSPFGGPIYIDVPEKMPEATFNVTVQNAVAAPLFVRGKTTLAEWKTARNAPAPWAELVGQWCTLTVPSSVVRTLEDPDALMAYWDDVMDACAAFYAVPPGKRHFQRYCTDLQISAGYMHSGYPIMTFEDVARTFVDLSVLRGNDGQKVWGFYHELGHNHQQPDWTWDGCGEVTNNLFSLYGGEKFNSVEKDYASSHPAIRPDARRKRLQAYFTGGAKYEEWKSDPFLALMMFIEMRQAFGWEPFTKVFAEYEALSPAQHPQNDEEKRDAFMVRFSRAVGKNLGPFFTAWRIPTSEAARHQIEQMPVWLPDEIAGLARK